MNRRDRRRQAASLRRARRAQKRREFEGIKALHRGGYMVLHPSVVRQWQIAKEAAESAAEQTDD